MVKFSFVSTTNKAQPLCVYRILKLCVLSVMSCDSSVHRSQTSLVTWLRPDTLMSRRRLRSSWLCALQAVQGYRLQSALERHCVVWLCLNSSGTACNSFHCSHLSTHRNRRRSHVSWDTSNPVYCFPLPKAQHQCCNNKHGKPMKFFHRFPLELR